MKNKITRTEIYINDQKISLSIMESLELPNILRNVPHTGVSIHQVGKIPLPWPQTMKTLKAHRLYPWFNNIFFLALVLAACELSPSSVHSMLLGVIKLFKDNRKYTGEKNNFTTDRRLNITSDDVNKMFE